MNKLLITLLFFVITGVACAQTSETNNRLKKALEKYPQADTNKDAILTLKEAKDYRDKNLPKEPQKAKGKVVLQGKELIYKKVGDVELRLYLYAPKGHSTEEKVPAILFFHGGAWKAGSPIQFQEHCKNLAGRGMVAITVEYRLTSKHQTKVTDCIEDAKSAMRWVRGHAVELGVDPDRIASGGGSAGGHLGTCTSVIDDFNAKTDDLKISPKPNAMVLFNPFMGLTTEQQETKARKKKNAAEELEKAIPLTFASKKQPPCIMFFGTEDDLLKGAQLYQTKSKAASNDCKIVLYKGQGHGFFNRGTYVSQTGAEMEKFLNKLGWLSSK